MMFQDVFAICWTTFSTLAMVASTRTVNYSRGCRLRGLALKHGKSTA